MQASEQKANPDHTFYAGKVLANGAIAAATWLLALELLYQALATHKIESFGASKNLPVLSLQKSLNSIKLLSQKGLKQSCSIYRSRKQASPGTGQ